MKTILGGFESQDDLMHMFGSFFSKFKKHDEHTVTGIGTESQKNNPKEGLPEEPDLFV